MLNVPPAVTTIGDPKCVASAQRKARDTVLADEPHFTLVHTGADALCDRTRWILPIDGHAAFGNEVAHAGECLLLHPHQRLDAVQGNLLVGAASLTNEAIMRQAA